jgi:WD40 repeat protein
VAFSPDGRKIVSAGHGALVKVWDAETEEVLLDHPAHKIMTWSVAWQPPDGLRIASAGGDGPGHAVKVWDAVSGRGIFELKTRGLEGARIRDARRGALLRRGVQPRRPILGHGKTEWGRGSLECRNGREGP